MSQTRIALGAHGENLAARHLEESGYHLIARNWRCNRGELDIVALAPNGELAIVEVKTRRTLDFGSPLEAITHQKLARLRRLTAAWLAEHPHRGDVRIDVISILVPAGGAVQLDHVQGIGQ